MATARKTTVDPLAEELPDEPRPQHALDVQFEVQIVPYIVTGTVYYRWTILKNNKRGWVGDYAGHNESGYPTADDAENGAALYVERIRHAVDLKLTVPDSYTITL
jgi:hypothetical protein